MPWQHWTKTLVWFDDVDIPAFNSFVFVDLWQFLSEWLLLVSACVLEQRTNIKFLVKLWKVWKRNQRDVNASSRE